MLSFFHFLCDRDTINRACRTGIRFEGVDTLLCAYAKALQFSDDCKSATVPILSTLLGIAFVIALICMIIIIMLSWRLKVERKKS